MPIIKKGSDYMNAITYTGNGSTQTINVGFQPDLVWIKSRSAATDNKLTDSVRGATLGLISNSTGAETTDSTGVTAFTSTGFTLGSSSTYNTNGATYVAWCWKESATAGFDIVTYTGNGGSGTRSVSHSLGVAPAMTIVKKRSEAQNWQVWHKSLTNYSYELYLNATDAQQPDNQFTDYPSSTNLFLNAGSAINTNGGTYVAYLFAEIPGYSKFGSYTGNGSTDGPFVYCGFRPKYVMVKITSSTGDWVVYDASRNTYNATINRLFPDLSDAESTGAGGDIDILSNGFKVRSNYGNVNASGATYVIAAFAENPFKYSNAR